MTPPSAFGDDETKRRDAEEALQRSEARFRTLFDQFPLSVQVLSSDGQTQRTNLAWQALFGAATNPLDDSQFVDVCDYILRGLGGETVALPAILHKALRSDGTPSDDPRDARWVQAIICPVRDETGKLLEVINVLQDVTERRRAEDSLRASEEGLERSVAERTVQLTDTNAALRAARDEAERANHAKSEFLSRMSHELRTPMNSILGFAQVLARKMTDPGQRKSVDHILHAGKHLLELINEVLDLSRIEANGMQLSPEPVHLGRIVGETLAIIGPLAAQRDCGLVNDLSGCAHHVMADSQRLTQVLLNLLSNAVKYNVDGGTITLACELHGGDRLRLHVTDTGRGMSAASMERLFNPFDRLGAESDGVEGTGLGLVLSKRLVEVMGGTLLVRSEVGRGSTFTVELARADDPREHLARGPQKDEAPAASVSARTSTVLYIEDNVANLSLVETIFAERPAIVLRSALQGRLGLALAIEHRPELILLDLHLPDMTGEAVLYELKRDVRTRDIPVVMLSADATVGQPERLQAVGALAYLTKPLDVDRLLKTVDLVLAAGEKF